MTNQLKKKFSLAQIKLFWLGCTLYVFVFLSAIVGRYGYGDDYTCLFAAQQKGWGGISITQGRPLLSLIVVAFEFIENIYGLAYLRALGLAGSLLLFFYFWQFLPRSHRGERHLGLLTVAFLAGISPSAVVNVGYSFMWFLPYANICGLMSGLLAWRGLEKSCSWATNLNNLIFGGVLLIISLMIYQPSAAFFIILPLVYARQEPRIKQIEVRRLFGICLFFFIVSSIYYLAWQSSLRVFSADNNWNSRVELNYNIPLKISFLITELLPLVFGYWGTLESSSIGLIVAGIALIGIALSLGAGGWSHDQVIYRSLISCMAIGIALAHVIAPKENIFYFRSLGALYYVVGFICFDGFRHSVRHLSERTKISGFAFITFASILSATYHLYAGMVRPNQMEVDVVRSTVSQWDAIPDEVVFIQPGPLPNELSTGRSVGEFYMFSTYVWNVPAPMLKLVVSERIARDDSSDVAVNFLQNNRFQVYGWHIKEKDLKTIDLFGFWHGSTAVHENHPYWGPSQQYGNGWRRVDWFGDFYEGWFPSIWHPLFGLMHCSGTGGGHFEFYIPDFGIMHTTTESFPLLTSKDHGDAWRFEWASELPWLATFRLKRATDAIGSVDAQQPGPLE
jgi:hypothetical protein